MALAKDMDRSAQDQVLELARLHNLFPLLAQQLMRLHPPGLEAAALRACTVEALVRQTMATQSLLTLTRAPGAGKRSRLSDQRRCVQKPVPVAGFTPFF